METKEILEKLRAGAVGELKGVPVDIPAVFAEISTADFIVRDKVISALSKHFGVSKPEMKKQFQGFQRARAAERRQKNFIENFVKKHSDLFDYEEFMLPDRYFLEDGYLCIEEENGGGRPLCDFFIIYEKIVAHDKAFFRMVDAKGNVRIASGRDLIKSDRLAQFFADGGDIYDSRKATLITSFISEFLRMNAAIVRQKRGLTETGWQDNRKEFYLPTYRSGEWLDEIPRSQIERRFQKEGDVKESIRMLRELAKGRAMLVSLFSLASSLFGILEKVKMNYVCHIGGLRGEGKSFAAKTAVSLWGVPDVSVYGTNWNATLNGLETYVDPMKDVVAWIDEMENAKSLNDVVQFVYSFAEGTGRSRAYVRDGDVLQRPTKTFRGGLLTTGEKGIDEVIYTVSERNRPLGLTRRVLDLNVKNLWEGINKAKVGDIMDENYGVFAPFWLSYIERNRKLANETFDIFKDELALRLDGKENLYYAMLVALSFLQNMKVISEDDYNRQYSYVVELIRDEQELMIRTKDIKTQFLDVLENYVAINHNKFYTGEAAHDEQVKEAFGKLNEEEEEVFILKIVFDELCKNHGFVKKQVLEALKAAHRLNTASGRFDRQARIGSRPVWGYSIRLKSPEVVPVEFVSPEGDIEGRTEVAVDENEPF